MSSYCNDMNLDMLFARHIHGGGQEARLDSLIEAYGLFFQGTAYCTLIPACLRAASARCSPRF